jgi:hypothetical protein
MNAYHFGLLGFSSLFVLHMLGTIHILRQLKGSKKAVFADVQYYIYADKVGGSEKVQNYADVIYEWSLTLNGQGLLNKIIAHFSFGLNKGDLYKTAELCIHFACQGELSVF